MPFRSKKQVGFLFSKHPKIAKEFADKTDNFDDLPEHVKDKPMSAHEKRIQSIVGHLKGMKDDPTDDGEMSEEEIQNKMKENERDLDYSDKKNKFDSPYTLHTDKMTDEMRADCASDPNCMDSEEEEPKGKLFGTRKGVHISISIGKKK